MRTIWHHDSNGRRAYFSSHLTDQSLIVRCASCGRRFRGRRAFQDEMSAARQRAMNHSKIHALADVIARGAELLDAAAPGWTEKI